LGSVPTSTGAPSGSGASQGSVTNKNADDHFSYVTWDEATIKPIQTVTPTDPNAKLESPDDQLRRMIKVSTWSPGLTLLYFHTPHEGLTGPQLVGAAAATLRQCKTFHDEQVARWLLLMHCVEVDMGTSDAATAERLGFKDGAIFSIVDQDLHVLATSKPIATSDSVALYLKRTLQSDVCAKQWALVQAQIDEQKKELEKARALATQEKWKESLEQYRLVLDSKVRVGEPWDEAAKEVAKAARKAEQADKK
jgi:hypothetical protein